MQNIQEEKGGGKKREEIKGYNDKYKAKIK